MIINTGKTETIEEHIEKATKIAELADIAYQSHKRAFEKWKEGEPVEAWLDDNCEVCVKYESGEFWHYKDLDLPFPTWW